MLRATLLALIAGVLFFGYVGYPVMYANARAHPSRAPLCCVTPAELGLVYEDVIFVTNDGLTLRGWYLPSRNRAAVIIAHGLGGNRVPHLAQAGALAKHGYGVLLFDLRAHGESEGNTATVGGRDVIAAVAYLKKRNEIDSARIGAIGFSLGGMASIHAAASSNDIRAVISDGAGPTAFRDEPKPESFGDWITLPFYWVVYQVWEWQGASAPTSMIEAVAKIAPRPVMLVAGGQNQFELGLQRRLFAAAGEPKMLWEIPEVGHGGGWTARPQEYEDRVVTFFDQALLNHVR